MYRRDFLASTSAFAALAACNSKPPDRTPPPDLDGIGVDIHTHIFNGRDIPVVGFLEQVLLRQAADPVDSAQLPALARLIIEVIVAGSTKDARTELAGLSRGVAAWSAQTDEQNLSKGIASFANRAQSNLRSLQVDPILAEDAALLDLLRGAAPVRSDFRSAAAPTSEADAIASAVFRPSLGDQLRSFGGSPGTSSIFSKLRWAAFLTNDRATILAELKRFYGRSTLPDGTRSAGIDVFSPSLVDMGLWFKNARDAGPGDDVADQLAVMSTIARREDEALILNFAPFCPLRAIKTPGWFDVVKDAVRTKGFAGVKLYPPVGFRPRGNDPAKMYGAAGRFQANGAQIDRVLNALYRWCAENAVPIKTHANDSIAAGVCTGAGAAPEIWGDVLNDYPNLRLNLAHFGGFERAPAGCPAHVSSFEAQAAALISAVDAAGIPRFAQVYADLGYWSEATRQNSSTNGATIAAFEAMLASHPRLSSHLIYGSDWSMIAQDKGFEDYYRDISATLRPMLGAEHSAVMGANALRFLDLEDATSPQSRRLQRFFPAGHFFYRLLPHQTPV